MKCLQTIEIVMASLSGIRMLIKPRTTVPRSSLSYMQRRLYSSSKMISPQITTHYTMVRSEIFE